MLHLQYPSWIGEGEWVIRFLTANRKLTFCRYAIAFKAACLYATVLGEHSVNLVAAIGEAGLRIHVVLSPVSIYIPSHLVRLHVGKGQVTSAKCSR